MLNPLYELFWVERVKFHGGEARSRTPIRPKGGGQRVKSSGTPSEWPASQLVSGESPGTKLFLEFFPDERVKLFFSVFVFSFFPLLYIMGGKK